MFDIHTARYSGKFLSSADAQRTLNLVCWRIRLDVLHWHQQVPGISMTVADV